MLTGIIRLTVTMLTGLTELSGLTRRADLPASHAPDSLDSYRSTVLMKLTQLMKVLKSVVKVAK